MLKLRKYQEQGIDFLKGRDRCLLADEMGLGKTVQAIMSVDSALIVCPASLVLNWKKECLRWRPNRIVVVLKEHDMPVSVKGYVIVSYHYLHNTAQLNRLLKITWPCIIADEAHHLKNWKSLTCRNFRKLKSKKLILMTGTPATKSAEDYYPYLNFVDGPVWGTPWEFRHAMCEQRIDEWSGGVKYFGVNSKARKVLKKEFKRFTLRRLKKDVEKELPPKVHTCIHVPPDEGVIAESLKLDRQVIRRCIEDDKPFPAHVAKVLSSIGMSKVGPAIDYCLGHTDQLVVFCQHRLVVSGIATALEKELLPFRCVTGNEDASKKNAAVEAFQNGEIRYIICNLNAGSVGLTLTAAASMLHVELPWSPAVLRQSYARIDRIGQRAKSLNYTRLHCPGTIDDDVWDALGYKDKFMQEIL